MLCWLTSVFLNHVFFLLVVFHVYEFDVLNVDKSVISLCVFVSLFPLCSTLINLCCF